MVVSRQHLAGNRQDNPESRTQHVPYILGFLLSELGRKRLPHKYGTDMGTKKSAVLLCLLGLLFCLSTSAMAEVITYPRPQTSNDARSDYPLLLLRLAFDKAGVNHQLMPSALPMSQDRAVVELSHGAGLRVIWNMTSVEREAQLLPIRIPIDKGLIGWRLPMVSRTQADLLANVHSLRDLQAYRAGQERDWPDTKILRANGLPVEGVTSYDTIFRMLAAKRFDYFPRSLVEIWAEAETHRQDGLEIDRHLVLHYPAAHYFFVNKRDGTLGEVIRRGLEKAIADGSFDKLFNQRLALHIRKAQLEQRTVIELENPLLPSTTPLERKE